MSALSTARRWWRRLWMKPLPEQTWYFAPRQRSDEPLVGLFVALVHERQIDEVERRTRIHRHKIDSAMRSIGARLDRVRSVAGRR